ncbi:MAG: hypothetical protein IPP74_10205 [Alphaproteobacteria bacterium]|nr:hypothetical protein [Alphaproteobacteria bacterium]
MTLVNDENLGHGGSYIIQDGVRVLVERTRSPQDVADFLNKAKKDKRELTAKGLPEKQEKIEGDKYHGTANQKANYTR